MCAGKGAAQEQREVWRGDKSERTVSPQRQLKSAVIVSKARLIVLLTKQVVLKSRPPLMVSRWKGAQKLTAESGDLLFKNKANTLAAHTAGILTNSPTPRRSCATHAQHTRRLIKGI